MNTSPKNDLPWELIAESLTGSLSVEGELQLQQWISSGTGNREKYLQIKELWKSGMEDYTFYRMANEEQSWKNLQAKMRHEKPEMTGIIQGQFNQRQKFVRNLIAIAAVFIGFVGIGLWFVLPKSHQAIYETAFNVQKRVTLTDGSVITLQPNTKIEVPSGYNKSVRTILMDEGEAGFNVVHNPGKSFIVDLGSTQIRDIGTSFTIHKVSNTIEVSVSTGKIAFIKLSTKETKELDAGSAITFDISSESFGGLRAADSLKTAKRLLTFENTPLSEVINSVQKVYGKRITLSDGITDKTFTGQLDGMSFKGVLRVLCITYGLEYSINDSIYILKAKKIEQP
jgi:ferric-dicitrate binding protein FerR (iron transport regulator)